MPISATNYDGTKNYNVAEMSDLCKPNLLLNADFRYGAVNQNESPSFERITKNSYTIDEWILHPKVREASFYLQESEGQIIIYQNNASGQARDGGQDINIVQHVRGVEQGKTYHLHFKYNSAEYDCNLTLGSATTSVTINTNILITMAYVSKNHYTLAINVKNKNANRFNFIKLEEGTTYTGMPVWNRSVELLKCQRYFIYLEYFKTIWTKMYQIHVDTIVLPTKMQKDPTVKITNVDKYGMEYIGLENVNTLRCEIAYKPDSSTGEGHRLGIIVKLDARDY